VAGESEENLEVITGSGNVAYVIYTSGSTGKPKGTVITHRSIARLLFNTNYVNLGPREVILQWAPLGFDASTFEVWSALLHGGCLLSYPDRVPTVERIEQIMASRNVTTLFAASALFNTIVDTKPEIFRGVQQLLVGGDALSVSHIRRAQASLPSTQFINGYGPTECTTFSCCYSILAPVPVEWRSIPIGSPISNTQVYVLDESLNPVPVGVAGELYIGGAGLARGYLKRAQLTAERFLPHPLGQVAGERLYRTGDVVRWREDGRLDFLGRMDNQVKIRGFRIEPGEIEMTLRQHAGVREAVVMVQEESKGGKRLVGYVVLEAGTGTGMEHLQGYLRERLPEYMVPGVLVKVEEIPLTANGKVDRSRLPEVSEEQGELQREELRTPVEELVGGIWAEVLGKAGVRRDQNFFELGGHSLLAMQVVARIGEVLGVSLSVRQLFENPQIGLLAEKIEQQRKGTQRGVPGIRRRKEGEKLPMSFAQQRLWFLQQFEPESVVYNIPLVLRMRGRLQVEVLEEALSEMVRRHEVLRTTFGEEAGVGPVQVVHEAERIRLRVVDVGGMEEKGEREEEVRRVVEQSLGRVFDLRVGPLLRVDLVRVEEEEHVLVLCLHHIISDGWSMGIMMRELAVLYEARAEGRGETGLKELEVQYGDYAVWQREWMQGEVLEEQMGYWRKQLAGVPELLELPIGKARPAVQSHGGREERFELGRDLLEQLQQVSRREGVTLFMTLVAGLQVLLWKYSGEPDIAVGTPIAGRKRREVEELIGFFVNTLVLRTRVSGERKLWEVLREVREVALGAYANQDVPFEKLVEELQPERDLSRTPLFQVLISLRNFPQGEWKLEGLELREEKVEVKEVKFDLTVALEEREEGLSGVIGYRVDLFERSAIVRMVNHWRRLLEQVAGEREREVRGLELMSAQERRQVEEEWNATAVEYPEQKTVQELFEEQVRRTPAGVAVVYEGEELSYEELNRRANRWAHYIRRRGVGAEVLVGICAERSVEMVVGLLGILKAGGGYVPLDPQYPEERLKYMLEDAGVGLVLTQKRFAAGLEGSRVEVVCLDGEGEAGKGEQERVAGESEENLEVITGSGNVAYVIYTSGSTGKPKGVVVAHEAICNRLLWMCRRFPLQASDRLLQKTPYSFDVSVYEFFWPLLSGAQLVMARPEGHRDITYLVETIQKQQITMIHFVPSMLRAFLAVQGMASCPGLKRVFCSGEALDVDLCRKVRAQSSAELHNLYGPTEAAVEVSHWECGPQWKEDVVPIGKAIANTRLHVLNEDFDVVPLNVTGELHLAGVQLARGYLNQPRLTAECFVPNPLAQHAGERMYRTGDVVRRREDGNIEYLGRADQQVKLRGFRIELGEIETVLSAHEHVQHCAVTVEGNGSGEKSLVVHVVGKEGDKLEAGGLRNYLRQHLPEYMVPHAFYHLEKIPVTSSGKLDRKALSSLRRSLEQGEPKKQVNEIMLLRHGDPTELYVTVIFEEVLGIKGLSSEDDFFEVGGHSLAALTLAARLSELYKKSVSVKTIFENPTIGRMAAYLRQTVTFAPHSNLIPINRRGHLLPFFCVHPAGGWVNCYVPLARALGFDRPLYGLQSAGLDEDQEAVTTIEEMAALYVKQIKEVQPRGPYQLGGWCMGATVAYEAAQQLVSSGDAVSLLAIFDEVPRFEIEISPITAEEVAENEKKYLRAMLRQIYPPKIKISGLYVPEELKLGFDDQLDLLLLHYRELGYVPKDITAKQYHRYLTVWATNMAAKKRYRLQPFPGQVTLFRSTLNQHADPTYGWKNLALGGLEIHNFDMEHKDFVVTQGNARRLAEVLNKCFQDSGTGSGASPNDSSELQHTAALSAALA
jgi:amino acid adenylation domain-containing protein